MKWPLQKSVQAPKVKREPATFAEIIQPLTGITARLEKHADRMATEKGLLESQKDFIVTQIADAVRERNDSLATAGRLRDFTAGTSANAVTGDHEAVSDE